MTTPRLRMFAGPNGSGKSTLKDEVRAELIGVYVNADEMEKSINHTKLLNFSHYQIHTTENEIKTFLSNSSLLKKENLIEEMNSIEFNDNKLHFNQIDVNSYHASVLSDFLRQKLLNEKVSFSFETVMSHEGKVDFLQKAQELGFRTYLYYVATEDPDINIERVKIRVANGGHPVPEDRIRSRYEKSLNLLLNAVEFSNRAYIFDNSNNERNFIAEITDADKLEIKTDQMPFWFKQYLWDKF